MGLLLSLNFNRRHSPFYRYQSIFIVAALNVLSANAQDEPAASYEVLLFFSADNPDYISFVQIKDYRSGRFPSRAAPHLITITGGLPPISGPALKLEFGAG